MTGCGARKQMETDLRPRRGGFTRPFGCGWFIREFLMGRGPNDSPQIDPSIGAPQADVFFHYKQSLVRAIALDRATRQEEKQARREHRRIDPEKVERLTERHLRDVPYKSTGARFHSFIVYVSNLRRLGWIEFTGREERSVFQDHYPPGPPRRYFRLTEAGKAAPEGAWRNPFRALYGQR
jgi:hypothetical protein